MQKKTAVRIAGVVLFLIAAIWMAVGFYMRNVPLLLGILAAAGVCLYVSSKMKVE